MVDYALDSNFELIRTPWGDFETVNGYAEFEDDLAVRLRDAMDDILSNPGSKSTATERLQLRVNRVAAQFGVIEEIDDITVTEITDGPNRYRVEITYLTQPEPFVDEL